MACISCLGWRLPTSAMVTRPTALPGPEAEPFPRRRSHSKRQSRRELRSEFEGARQSRRHSRSRGRKEKGPNDRRSNLRELDRNSRRATAEASRDRQQQRWPKDDWRDEYPSQSRRSRRPEGTVELMKPLPRTPRAPRRYERQHGSITKEPIIHIEELEIEDSTLKRDCLVCVESRSLRHFPKRPPTGTCQHEINTCKRCLRHWINSEFGAKVWDQMSCPECGIKMGYDDMKAFAPSDVFKR